MSTTHSPSAPPRSVTGRTTHYPLGWLRGLAATAVVIFHAYQHNRDPQTWEWPFAGRLHTFMTGTDLFVDMFFVLSALVLWLPVARAALDGTPGRPGWEVLLRRSARLLPLYLTVVLVVWAVTNPTLPGHWGDLLTHLTFTHVYSDEYIFWTNGPAWSLAVELHFYVLVALTIPWVRAGARRASTHAGRVAVTLAPAVVLAVVGMSYLGYQILLAQPAVDDWSVWFQPLAKLTDFAIGMALAVASAAGVRLGALARRGAVVVSVTALVVLVMTRPFETLGSNWWHPMYALAIAVGLASIVLHDGPYARWLDWRPLAWVGGLGYGIYLIHEPVMRYLDHLGVLPEPRPGLAFLLTAVLVSVPTVALAWLSSKTLESSGLKVLETIEPPGRSRDYYRHVERSGR